MALIFTLSPHLARDVLADELAPRQHHSLWRTLCHTTSKLSCGQAMPASPHHQPKLQQWLLEKGPSLC